MEKSTAEKFIDHIESIKDSYESKYNVTFKGFGEAWRYAIKKNDPVARRHRNLGNALGELRNAISHSSYREGTPIAVPRKDLVDAAEKLAEAVNNPARIDQHMNRGPVSLTPESTLPNIAKIISENDFSQIPICSNGRVVSLLTTNAVSRWLAISIDESGEIYEDAAQVTAERLLAYAEEADAPKYVKPTCPAYRVCDMLSNENSIPAILVTPTGDRNSDLMGIVTISDVPAILKKLDVKVQ